MKIALLNVLALLLSCAAFGQQQSNEEQSMAIMQDQNTARGYFDPITICVAAALG
jgi:hypothetical protein